MGELVLSLFPGIGLLDRAFEAEDYCIVRGPDVLWGGDIRRFHPPAGRFDGVIGGPPCQSFSSLVHLVRANGHEPRFGNLIPEFERCVVEAQPAWFLMENVPQAPTPEIEGYGINSFLLDNSHLDDGTGFGLEQRRVRRFSFGMRGVDQVPCLMRWISLAVFLLPDAVGTTTQYPVDNSAEAKGRRLPAVTSTDGGERPSEGKTRRQAILRDPHAVPVAIGGSGKRKPGARVPAVNSGHDDPNVSLTLARRERKRKASVTSNVGGRNSDSQPQEGRAASGRGRYRLAEACRLQGLPEDFLDDAPFTAEGKLKAVANGVPLPMGLAIAKAIKQALREAGL